MFPVDRSLPTPLPTQIAAGLRARVSTGNLTAGDRVPSTRELARQLGVSRGSVVSAYDQLISEGLLLSAQGAPTVVHPDLPRLPTALSRPARSSGAGSPPTISLKPSSGHAGTIRPTAWRKAWREAAAAPDASIDKSGQPALRGAIAEHVRLARGLAVDPDSVVVTGGAREGLLLILMSLGHALRVGVEEPGHPGLRRVIPLAGHTPVTCCSDEAGVDVSALPDDLDALLVTPAHLYPLGGSMPAARRAALLEWAERTGAVIIEDDYNSELRYRIAPQPTLSALAADARVLTLGTFTTLLSRHLSAGYVVADDRSAPALLEAREALGMPVSSVTQHAIAHLLDGGYVRRNTKAVHNRLLRRRRVIQERVIPALRQLGAEAVAGKDTVGVDIAVTFLDARLEAEFRNRLSDAGVECGRLAASSSEPRVGCVLSFAHLSDDDFEMAVSTLASLTPRH